MHKAHANPLLTIPEEALAMQELIHLNFIGSQQTNEISTSEPSAHYYNFLKGNDPNKWARNVHAFDEVSIKDFYSGIDLKVINKEHQFKYEFVVSPGADVSQVALQYVGQKNLTINTAGDIEIETKLGIIYEEHPYAFQYIDGVKKTSTMFF